MLGAIAGDIAGSAYEFDPVKEKDIALFDDRAHFTDDTVLTVAVAEWLMTGCDLVSLFHHYFLRYPEQGYGARFIPWALRQERAPYNSWGSGAAMRVSAAGWAFDTMDEVLEAAASSAAVSHDHPEGIKGAQAVAAAIYLARKGEGKAAIQQFIERRFGYSLNDWLDDIRETYTFDESCQGSVPQSIIAFLEGDNFEDTLRNAISLGGDADTMACIAGSIAEAYWGVPDWVESLTRDRLDGELLSVVDGFQARYC